MEILDCSWSIKKKFRGQKRYYKYLEKEAAEFTLPDLSDDLWYDEWHEHPDFFGYGRLGWKHRQSHLKALFTMFERALDQLRPVKKPYQIWLTIWERSSEFDAINLHTPNPNDDNFPFEFKDSEWNVEVPWFLADFVRQDHEIGTALFEGERLWIVRHKEQGFRK